MTSNSGSENLVWHYTSLSTLLNILDKREFWAGEASFQNDPAETQTARSVMDAVHALAAGTELERFTQRVVGVLDHLIEPGAYDLNEDRLLREARFVLCASADGDNLYAWRTYASKESIGCAVALDSTAPLTAVSTSSRLHVNGWTPVSYDSDQDARSILREIEQLKHEYDASGHGEEPDLGIVIQGIDAIWSRLVSRAKHPSYREEQEARLTVSGLSASDVRFMNGVAGPRPYVRIIAASAGATAPELLPIRAVRLAPNAPARAAESVTWMLALHGYPIDGVREFPGEDGVPWINSAERVKILTSRHPFRDA